MGVALPLPGASERPGGLGAKAFRLLCARARGRWFCNFSLLALGVVLAVRLVFGVSGGANGQGDLFSGQQTRAAEITGARPLAALWDLLPASESGQGSIGATGCGAGLDSLDFGDEDRDDEALAPGHSRLGSWAFLGAGLSASPSYDLTALGLGTLVLRRRKKQPT